MTMLNSRKSLKSAGWSSVGWLWVVALLALPDCVLDRNGTDGPLLTTAVFCDIQKGKPEGRHCATPFEINVGMRQASAAVALNTGQTAMMITLDYSPAALAACAATTGGPLPASSVESRTRRVATVRKRNRAGSSCPLVAARKPTPRWRLR